MGYPALFYNAVDNDRTYDADSFERWLKKFFTSGVFAGDLGVTAGTGMTVTVAPGYANTDGKVRFFDEATTLSISTAHATLKRIDNIVIERDDAERDITLKVITGTPASNPTPVAPVRSNGIYQLILARVTIPAGAASITNLMITDTRAPAKNENPVLCGIVADATGQIDIQGLMEIYKAQFEEWFENIQDILDENVAGHLQNEIDDLETSLSSAVSTINTTIDTQYSKTLHDAIEVTLPNVSSSSRTFNVTGITADHELVQNGAAYLSNPAAAGSDLTLTTASGKITVAGTLTGTTNIVATFCIKETKATGST